MIVADGFAQEFYQRTENSNTKQIQSPDKEKNIRSCFYEVNITWVQNLKDWIQNRITDKSSLP